MRERTRLAHRPALDFLPSCTSRPQHCNRIKAYDCSLSQTGTATMPSTPPAQRDATSAQNRPQPTEALMRRPPRPTDERFTPDRLRSQSRPPRTAHPRQLDRPMAKIVSAGVELAVGESPRSTHASSSSGGFIARRSTAVGSDAFVSAIAFVCLNPFATCPYPGGGVGGGTSRGRTVLVDRVGACGTASR
jgi:hypothetical protein